MRFDGFVSHFSLVASGLAAVCLALALIASSVVVARKVEAAVYHVPSAYGEIIKQG